MSMKNLFGLVLALSKCFAWGARVEVSDLQGTIGKEEHASKISICAAVSQETLQTHRQCSANLQKPGVLERFPNLHKDWCDQQLAELTNHHCESEEEDRLQVAAMLEVGFRRMTALIGTSEEALTADKAWEGCSGRQHSCMECESRYAGAREYLPTTHACEWRAGSCVRSARLQPRPWSEAASVCGEDAPASASLAELGQTAAVNGSASGRKAIAILIGVTYQEGHGMLRGTYPDIKNMFRLLVERKGFDPRAIYVFYDRGTPEDFGPQAVESAQYSANIVPWNGYASQFWELAYRIVGINQLGEGDYFLFYFSGHGAQTEPGSAPSELDGKDEFLVTPNFDRLMDNDFYNFLVRMPKGMTVTGVADACHSEGFSDLPFNYMAGDAYNGHHLLGPGAVRFQSLREWCTDWLQAPDVLPRARITFISGSQNSQTSSDVGTGGVLTLYAMEHWVDKTEEEKVRWNLGHKAEYLLGISDDLNGGGGWERGSENSLFNRFKAMRKLFKNHHTQQPNVCAFPIFGDHLDFEPFTPPTHPQGVPNHLVDYHPFAGGQRPFAGADMAGPPICQHDGRWQKAQEVLNQPLEHHHLNFHKELKPAAKPYEPGDWWVGWEVEYTVQLPPSSLQSGTGLNLSPVAADVVGYVVPGSNPERAGLRVGDIIRSINGEDFNDMGRGARYASLRAGGAVQVVGTRN